MSVALHHPFTRMTLDEFYAWDSGDFTGRDWQLMDGEPVPMALGTDVHGSIQAELGGLLGNHLVEQGSVGRVIMRPGVVPRVWARENFRIADLGMTRALPKQGCIAVEAPVSLVEVLTPNDER